MEKLKLIMKNRFYLFWEKQLEIQYAGMCLLVSGALPENKSRYSIDPQTNKMTIKADKKDFIKFSFQEVPYINGLSYFL